MLVTYALVGMEDRSAALAVLEHLETAPVLLVLFAPFLIGMFGGVAVLTVGLFRAPVSPAGCPRAGRCSSRSTCSPPVRQPVDPHWLFLAGAVGVAAAGRPAATKR
jgi:hypothetical protein